MLKHILKVLFKEVHANSKSGNRSNRPSTPPSQSDQYRSPNSSMGDGWRG